MTARRWSVGLMTGTVLDGEIDVALLRTDGEAAEAGPWSVVRYEPGVVTLLTRALEAARAWGFGPEEPAVFARAERALTEAQSRAVLDVLAGHGIGPGEIEVVGFHGQTVLHRGPSGGAPGRTRQLGDGALMARRTGIDVVADMRADDMAAGGHGAPLAPLYHRALLRGLGAPATAFLNLGGVANLTWSDGEALVAFDAGPANAPINDWARAREGAEMDRDGRLAASGRVDEARLGRLLAHPFFAAAPPKSLDRFDFPAAMADGLGPEDGAATLTAFAAAAVAQGLDHLPSRPTRLVVGGGGRRNPTLMREVAVRTGCEAVSADAVGLRGDAIEAEAFAFLAARRLRGLPTSLPATTGARRPVSGGRIFRRPGGG